MKPQKSCYRTTHHLPVLVTKAWHRLLLIDSARKRGKEGKKERQHRMDLGKWTKGRGDMVVVMKDNEKRGDMGVTEQRDSIQQASLKKTCFLCLTTFPVVIR